MDTHETTIHLEKATRLQRPSLRQKSPMLAQPLLHRSWALLHAGSQIMKIVSLRYGANHSLKRQMRKISKSYYERGADQTNVLLLPLLENYARLTSGCKDRQGPRRTHQS